MPLTIAQKLTYNTVRIECETPAGGSLGTGFIFSFPGEGDRTAPVLVTNRHVVEGATAGEFRLHARDANNNVLQGQQHSVRIEPFADSWIGHPDPNIDLCILPLATTVAALQDRGLLCFMVENCPSVLPTAEDLLHLSALTSIVMIGYPIGIWDAANCMPLCRQGIAATHPYFDYDGRREFIIDAACYPGSSGSPVYYYDRGANVGPFPAPGVEKVKLLGILWGGPQHTVEGDIQAIPIPTRAENRAIVHVPMNLGYVIKSACILDFEPMLREGA